MPAFVFDLDGTLVDTVQPHTVIWQKVLAEARIVVPANRIQFWIGAGSRKLALAAARRAKKSIEPSDLDVMRGKHQAMMAEWANPPVILPGAVGLLRELRDRGIRYGIATSGRHPAVGHALEALQVPAEIPLITFHDVTRNKPHPECLLRCAEKMKVPPSDCIMVGDAVWDILAARNAGMLPVGIRTGGASPRRLRRAGAARLFRDPRHLWFELDSLLNA